MTEPVHRITFDPQLHKVGRQVGGLPAPMEQALAWWVAAELVRRNPGDVRLAEGISHYESPLLDAYRRDPRNPRQWRPVAAMYWSAGGIIINGHYGTSGEQFSSFEVIFTEDRRQYVVAQLEAACGLPSPKRTPATMRSSIGPRVIAVFLQRTAFERRLRWYAKCGWDPGDDWSFPGAADGLFEGFADADNARRTVPPDEQPLGAESRYWFICPVKSGDHRPPVAVIDNVAGIAWGAMGRVNLLPRYRKLGSSIDALVSDVMPPAR